VDKKVEGRVMVDWNQRIRKGKLGVGKEKGWFSGSVGVPVETEEPGAEIEYLAQFLGPQKVLKKREVNDHVPKIHTLIGKEKS